MAARIASVGTSRSILDLRPAEDLLASAFMDLPPLVERLRTAHQARTAPDWQGELARCRRVLDEISRLIDKRGASTEALYRHELLGRN